MKKSALYGLKLIFYKQIINFYYYFKIILSKYLENDNNIYIFASQSDMKRITYHESFTTNYGPIIKFF